MKVTPGYANSLPKSIRLDLEGSTVRSEGNTIGSLQAAVCKKVSETQDALRNNDNA
jgi:hypothetical protein